MFAISRANDSTTAKISDIRVVSAEYPIWWIVKIKVQGIGVIHGNMPENICRMDTFQAIYLERYQGFYQSIADEVIDQSIFEDIDYDSEDLTDNAEDSDEMWCQVNTPTTPNKKEC